MNDDKSMPTTNDHISIPTANDRESVPAANGRESFNYKTAFLAICPVAILCSIVIIVVSVKFRKQVLKYCKQNDGRNNVIRQPGTNTDGSVANEGFSSFNSEDRNPDPKMIDDGAFTPQQNLDVDNYMQLIAQNRQTGDSYQSLDHVKGPENVQYIESSGDSDYVIAEDGYYENVSE